jgi:hypothetical protein
MARLSKNHKLVILLLFNDKFPCITSTSMLQIPNTLNLFIHCLSGSHRRYVYKYQHIIVFHTELINMFMMCLNTKFHMASSSGPLVIAVKWKDKYIFREAAFSKVVFGRKLHFSSNLYYHTVFIDPTLIGCRLQLRSWYGHCCRP